MSSATCESDVETRPSTPPPLAAAAAVMIATDQTITCNNADRDTATTAPSTPSTLSTLSTCSTPSRSSPPPATSAAVLSSPIKGQTKHHAQHNRMEVQEAVKGHITIVEDVEQFKKEFRLSKGEWRKIDEMHAADNVPETKTLTEHDARNKFIVGFGNRISVAIRDSDLINRQLAPKRLIEFVSPGHCPPVDHPTGTHAVPDVVVLWRDKDSPLEMQWPNLESVSENHSKGTNQNDSVDQTLAYTCFLLQARPDRFSVLTFHIGYKGLTFFVTNAEGCKRTKQLLWDNPTTYTLLRAFVYRLYEPHPSMVDSSIVRVKLKDDELKKDNWRFHVQLKGRVEPSPRPVYSIEHAGYVFGGRNSVFKNVANPMTIDGKVVGIIKEQYIVDGHRFEESDVIQHIHADGIVPGVVAILHHEIVERLGRKPGEYRKDRLAEEYMGKPLVEATTIREFLIGLYDMLEIGRYIYTERKVLHRDISKNNVRVNTANPGIDSDIPASELCCARYLLGETEKSTALTSSLIDFNRSEIREQKEDKPRIGRTGTPVFIARAISKGGPLEGFSYKFPAMPWAPQGLPRGYRKVLSTRFGRFVGSKAVKGFIDTQDQNDVPEEPEPEDDPEEESNEDDSELGHIQQHANEDAHKPTQPISAHRPWRHELYHDAESAFWLLVWWAIQALPNGADAKAYQIPLKVWMHLTDHAELGDDRQSIVANMYGPKKIIHPHYEDIRPLIQALWSHIQHDHYWAPHNGPLREPDFVHEAFQRIILSFLIQNKKKPFLTLEKNPKQNRAIQEAPRSHADHTSAGVETRRNQTYNGLKRDSNTQEALDDKKRGGKRARSDTTL